MDEPNERQPDELQKDTGSAPEADKAVVAGVEDAAAPETDTASDAAMAAETAAIDETPDESPEATPDQSATDTDAPEEAPGGTAAEAVEGADVEAAEEGPLQATPEADVAQAEAAETQPEGAEGLPEAAQEAPEAEEAKPEDIEERVTSDSGEEVSMMELLMEQGDFMPEKYRRGDLVEGRVLRKTKDQIILDIGAKQEGVVPGSDLARLPAEVIDGIEVGDTIQTVVIRPEGREGEVLVSINQARTLLDWDRAVECLESGEIMELEIVGFNKGGALVGFGNLQGFVPRSHLVRVSGPPSSEDPTEGLVEIVGESIPVKVIEVNRRKRRLIMSERLAIREWRSEKKQRLLDQLHEGEIRHGRVSSIADFGAFVDLGGADGLVHVSELTYERGKHPRDVVSVGQEVDVYVLSIDRERKRIGLSMKRLQNDPWETVEEEHYVGELVEAVISNLAKFGAFARLDDGLEGLIHISELSDEHIEHPREAVSPGQRVTVEIISIEPHRQRIGLSVRRVPRHLRLVEAAPEPVEAEGQEEPETPLQDTEIAHEVAEVAADEAVELEAEATEAAEDAVELEAEAIEAAEEAVELEAEATEAAEDAAVLDAAAVEAAEDAIALDSAAQEIAEGAVELEAEAIEAAEDAIALEAAAEEAVEEAIELESAAEEIGEAAEELEVEAIEAAEDATVLEGDAAREAIDTAYELDSEAEEMAEVATELEMEAEEMAEVATELEAEAELAAEEAVELDAEAAEAAEVAVELEAGAELSAEDAVDLEIGAGVAAEAALELDAEAEEMADVSAELEAEAEEMAEVAVELDAEAEEMAEVSTELEAEAEDALDEVLEEDLSGEAAGAEGLEHSEDERSNGD